MSQWLTKAMQDGVNALHSRKAAGPTPRLTAEQRAQLPELLSRGSEAYGFRGDLWTRERVATVVKCEFGVSYSLQQIGRLLPACGWKAQKLVKRAGQRNDEAIQRWQGERWPEIKKALAEARTLVRVDEAGFYLLSAVLRTYAPVGQTLISQHCLINDHLSAISGITPDGKLSTIG